MPSKEEYARAWVLAKMAARGGIYKQARKDSDIQYEAYLKGFEVNSITPALFEVGLRLLTLDAYFLHDIWASENTIEGVSLKEAMKNPEWVAYAKISEWIDSNNMAVGIFKRYHIFDGHCGAGLDGHTFNRRLVLDYGWVNQGHAYFMRLQHMHGDDTPEKMSIELEYEKALKAARNTT